MTTREVVMQEAKRLLLGMIPLGLIEAGVFAYFGQADGRMFISLFLGMAYTMISFFLIGRNAERAVLYPPAQAERIIPKGLLHTLCPVSRADRAGFSLPQIHAAAAIVPLFFPKLVLLASSIFRKKGG